VANKAFVETTVLIPSFRYILDKLPAQKQVIAFSATFDDTLYDLLSKYMNNPQKVMLTTDAPVLEGMSPPFKVLAVGLLTQ
jgi:superfamily II DNA/RNA helicase